MIVLVLVLVLVAGSSPAIGGARVDEMRIILGARNTRCAFVLSGRDGVAGTRFREYEYEYEYEAGT